MYKVTITHKNGKVLAELNIEKFDGVIPQISEMLGKEMFICDSESFTAQKLYDHKETCEGDYESVDDIVDGFSKYDVDYVCACVEEQDPDLCQIEKGHYHADLDDFPNYIDIAWIKV